MRTLFATPLLILVPFLVLSDSLVAQNQDELFQNRSSLNEFQSPSGARVQPVANQSSTRVESDPNGPISSYSSSTGSIKVQRLAIQGALVLLVVICCAAMLKIFNRGPTKAPPPPIRL